MTRKETALDILGWSFDHILMIGLLAVTISAAVIFGPVFGERQILIQTNNNWFNSHYPRNSSDRCDYGFVDYAYCVVHNATIVSVRDYMIECDTWFSAGTCPREDLGLHVDTGYSFNATINCHYYRIGDHVFARERFTFHNLTNTTSTDWLYYGGPC